MSSHEKSHSNNFHGHFPGVDNEKNEIDGFYILCYDLDFLVKSEE